MGTCKRLVTNLGACPTGTHSKGSNLGRCGAVVCGAYYGWRTVASSARVQPPRRHAAGATLLMLCPTRFLLPVTLSRLLTACGTHNTHTHTHTHSRTRIHTHTHTYTHKHTHTHTHIHTHANARTQRASESEKAS